MLTTLADLENSVYANLDNNSQFYPLAEVRWAINEAVRVLNLFTGFWQDTVTVATTTAGVTFYATPATILFPLLVYFNGRPLRKQSLGALSKRYRGWMAQTTTNFGPVQSYVPLGLRLFAIHPTDSVGGNTLTMDGVIEPTPLANETDVVPVPDEFADALVELATHVLQLKEGGKVFTDASASYQVFLTKMKELARWQGFRAPRYWIEAEVTKKA